MTVPATNARIWLDVDHPANPGVLRSMQSRSRKRSRGQPLTLPDSQPDPYSKCGSHPDVVERLAEQAIAWQKTLPPGPVEPQVGKVNYAWPKPFDAGK